MRQIFEHKCAACDEYSFHYHEGSHTEQAYRWVCNNCGIEMSLKFSDGGKQVEQSPTGRRCDRTLALLRMRGNHNFMFIYEGVAWDGDLSGHEYFYEEHTCPTNLMRCVEVIADGEDDPHGVFELVAEYLITGPNSLPREQVIEILTALAKEKTNTSKNN